MPAILIGCQEPTRSPPSDGFVPFEGADVVGPEDSETEQRRLAGSDDVPRDLPVDQYVIRQFERYASRVAETLRVAPAEVLWFDGPEGRREGVAVVLLVRNDVYGRPPRLALQGRTRTLLVNLMGSVGGHVTNLHRINENATTPALPVTASMAQAVYAVLKSVGETGRIQNANRWVIGRFREADDPVKAFRPMFDDFWEACDSLRASQPVLIVGKQVMGEDDLRLRRLYRQAHRPLDWPSYAGSAPDPGLKLGPKPTRPPDGRR